MKLIKKMTHKQKEIITIIFMSIILFASIFLDISGFQPLSFLAAKNDNVFLELFAVQATVSTLSIAIVSILSGLISVSYYGISVTRYVSDLKPCIFKFKRVIVLGLLISFINYFFTAWELYNLEVYSFFLSMCSTVYLILEVYIIYSGKDRIKREIYEYYLNNYKDIGIKHLEESLLRCEQTGEYTNLEDGLKLLKEVYEREIDKAAGDYKDMDSLLSEVFTKLNNEKDTEKLTLLLSFVLELYIKANSKSDVVTLNLWEEISSDVYISFRLLDFSQWEVRYSVVRIHEELFRNQKITKELIEDFDGELKEDFVVHNCRNLQYYTVEVYWALMYSEKDKGTFDMIIGDLILQSKKLLKKFPAYEHNELTSYKSKLLLTELCRIYRLLAYYKESGLIEKYVFYRYENNCFLQTAELTLLIYLYYLSYEPLISAEQKQSAAELTKQNAGKIYSFMFRLKSSLIADYYDFIKSVVWAWEEMPENSAKTLIIDRAILDVVIYSFLVAGRNEQELSKVIHHIFKDRISQAYLLYCRESDEELKKSIKQFAEFFHLQTTNDCHRESILIRKVISELYLKNEIEDLKNTVWDSRKKYQEVLSKSVDKFTQTNSFLFSTPKEGRVLLKKNHILFRGRVFASMYSAEEFIEQYKSFIESNIIQYIISDSVAEGHIPVRKLKRNDKNKQKQLIKMAFEQRLNTDTLIGGSNYYPYESNPFMLMKHCKDYNKIETETGEKRVYLLDSKKITAVVSDISFYMYNISEEELNSRKRKLEDGTITYRTTNNSYLPFSREQYRRYINQHEKIVLITARIEVQFEDDICGVGIEVL